MPQQSCTTCPRPVPDTAYGCLEDAVLLAGEMGRLAAVVPELETTVARLGRRESDGPRPAGAEMPLPYDVHAAEQRDRICGELTTWARIVQEETRSRLPTGHPAVAAATLLAGSMDWLRYRPSWPEAYTALSGLLRQALRVVDLPPDRQYVGPCSHVDTESNATCGADVYARPGAVVTACRECGTEYDVEACKAYMRGKLIDVLARPVEIAGIMLRLGTPIGYSTIAAYVADGRVVGRGRDGYGRELYRIGDVIEVRWPATRQSDVLAERAAQR